MPGPFPASQTFAGVGMTRRGLESPRSVPRTRRSHKCPDFLASLAFSGMRCQRGRRQNGEEVCPFVVPGMPCGGEKVWPFGCPHVDSQQRSMDNDPDTGGWRLLMIPVCVSEAEPWPGWFRCEAAIGNQASLWQRQASRPVGRRGGGRSICPGYPIVGAGGG